MNKKAVAIIKWVGFAGIVIGGAVVSFVSTQNIKVIGGLLIAVGAAIASLT